MRYALLALLTGLLSLSVCHAGPKSPHRLQVRFEAETVSAELMNTFKKRAESYAAFRGLGPALVQRGTPKASSILVEFPLREGEAASSEPLQRELRTLFTRAGGLEFTWDKGAVSLDALKKLQAHIGDGQIETKGAPRLKIDSNALCRDRTSHLKAQPTAGIRWL